MTTGDSLGSSDAIVRALAELPSNMLETSASLTLTGIDWSASLPTLSDCAADPAIGLVWSGSGELTLSGWRAARSWSITHNGDSVGPYPLALLVDPVWWDQVPEIPGVDLRISIAVEGTPFGSLSCGLDIVDGQPTRASLGSGPGADVCIRVDAARLADAVFEDRSPVEAVTGNDSIQGDLDYLMMAAGLFGSPEWLAFAQMDSNMYEACQLLARPSVVDALQRIEALAAERR